MVVIALSTLQGCHVAFSVTRITCVSIPENLFAEMFTFAMKIILYGREYSATRW